MSIISNTTVISNFAAIDALGKLRELYGEVYLSTEVYQEIVRGEALWDDLSRNPETLESPSWHEEILRERQQRLAAGEESFMDWEQAKADIRRRAS